MKNVYTFSKPAFTLVELLVVVSIIGILAGITLSILSPQIWRNRAQDSVRKEDLAVIQGALERWYADHNEYPDTLSFDTPEAGLVEQNDVTDTDDDVFYLRELPTDPDGINAVEEYRYEVAVNNQTYILCATLEEPGPDEDEEYCVTNPF